MERIYEIINTVEEDLKKEVKIEAIGKLEGQLQSFNTLVTQIADKMREAASRMQVKDTSDFDVFFKTISGELNQINVNFADFINLTKKMETQEVLKQFLVQKLDQIFKNMATAAAQYFNLSTLEIYDEFTAKLKTEMETSLFKRIEQELFSIQDGLGKFKKTYEMAGQQFAVVQQSIGNLQNKFQEQLSSIRSESEIIGEIFPKVDELFKTLSQEYGAMQKEIGSTLETMRQAPLQLLEKLRVALRSHEASTITQQTQLKGERATLQTDLEVASKQVESLSLETKLSEDEIRRMREEHRKMKKELEQVSVQLEKVTDEFTTLSSAKQRRIERTEILALLMTLLVEVFGAQPHSKLLFLLHGQKADISRDELRQASGISGAMVRKALADLDGAKLVQYDVESGMVTLLKRIYE